MLVLPSDVAVAMSTTGYNAIMNSCRGISTPDASICETGTLACQKAAVTGAAFKNIGRAITSTTYSGTVAWPCPAAWAGFQ